VKNTIHTWKGLFLYLPLYMKCEIVLAYTWTVTDSTDAESKSAKNCILTFKWVGGVAKLEGWLVKSRGWVAKLLARPLATAAN
jgi:hypothetical protein